MNISQKLVVLFSFAITLCLNACGGITKSDKPATITWWLTPYTGMAQVASADLVSPVSVNVNVVPGLDTDQILTLSDSSELKPYAGARWADHLPELATSLVSRTVDASGRFEVVSDNARAGSGKCDLNLELRKFFAKLDSSGQTTSVQVAIDGRFQCDSDEPVHFQSDASIRVNDERMQVIVAAFQRAMDNTMKDMLASLP
jgi:ABC-type uncharacterized transport system auxiliary subunit